MTTHLSPGANSFPAAFDVICFCHLRWDFVFQRPQHLMSRFTEKGRVFLIEEPMLYDGPPFLDISARGENIFICVPKVPHEYVGDKLSGFMADELKTLILDQKIENYIEWFYTPMMLPWADGLSPKGVIYDCMDELSGFKDAPPELLDREKELFAKADIVFTGGRSLYEAKRAQHPEVHAFPSSIDKTHFARAVEIKRESTRAGNDRPQIGFVGVIDERMDIALLEEIANLKTEWNFVMVGPVVKIDENDLPNNRNIHYLGQKAYDELPTILAGWDAAIMPFALNDSTKFISPTKTPEYLVAGLPVVSTPITDVIRPYGELGLVLIASTPVDFVEELEKALDDDSDKRMARVSEFMNDLSWDKTFRAMCELIEGLSKARDKNRSAASVGQGV